MAKKRSPSNQIVPIKPQDLPEYSELISIMQSETASILTDYVRQYVGIASQTPEPGQGIFINWDRVIKSQTYQELAWYELYQEVERDPHVTAIMGSAKLNVAGMKWDISAHIEAGQKRPTSRNQAIADFTKHALTNTGFFPQHMYNLMGALGMGFAVSEILWKISDEGIVIDKILNRPQRRFQFDAVDRSLKLRNTEQPYYGIPLPDKKFIVHRCSAQWDNPFGDALDQSIYWMWLFKKTVFKFWIQHLQVGAASVPIVKHPASANKQLKAEALEIAAMIRNGAYGRIPDNFEVIWAEAKNALVSAEAYQTFMRTVNDEISKCINGQTLTAEASSNVGTGSRALGAVHQVTQNARDVFRAEALASTLNASLIKWLVDFNFANVEGYPQFRFDLEDEKDLATESSIVKNLSDAGYDFDVEELSEKFNYDLTKKEAPKQLAPPVDPTKPVEPPVELSEVPLRQNHLARFAREFAETLEHDNVTAQKAHEKEKAEREKELKAIKNSIVEMAAENKTTNVIQKLLYKLADKEPVVNVTSPAVHVPAPVVHVQAAEFKQLEPNVIVNVPAPVVNVTVENPDKELIVERDTMGWIKRAYTRIIGKVK
jgi:phage gp29-like protein